MSYSTLTRFGPGNTPGIIKGLIITTVVAALFSAAVQTIFDQFGLRPGPQELLSLSWQGMRSFYLWEIVTFLFIQSSSSYGITFFYLVTLFFTMYLLWVLGSAVVELTGKGAFARFYFFCGCGAGVISLLLMPITGQYAMLAGTAPVILALLTVWSMAYPDSEVLLFFLIPVQAKWLVAGLLAITLLITLSHWDLPSLTLYVSAILLGYGYACTAWGWHSPFPFMHRLDALLATLGLRLRRILALPSWLDKRQKGNGKPSDAAKVVDISTGKTVSKDDAFIDEMLAKISKHGEGSLSWNERRRMQQISEQKIKDRDIK
jgi:membrane associated rhomboid family serine protease